MDKPVDVFDRDDEWTALEAFVNSGSLGASMGLVYGRRRQGKTFLLEAVASACGGFYFTALEQSSAQNLRWLADRYRQFTGSRAGVSFSSWREALEAVLALGEGASDPVVVVIDEFPYLLDGAPELPSLLQALLSPRGRAVSGWKTRLILCGSALSTMRELLAGTAPLRGRASLELVVAPFGYRDAARFWQMDDPDLAMRVHALVGGTPAYYEMCNRTKPTSSSKLSGWAAATLLNPASAMFREGNVLVSEESEVKDTSLYLAVLSAISAGRTRRSEIAAALGRAESSLTHPLGVLVAAGLVEAAGDALRQKRTTYHVTEPVLRLHQLVVAPNEARLVRHHGEAVWSEAEDTVSSRIYGPHFEALARTWCAEHASAATLGGRASRVAPTEVACPQHKTTHQLDVVVQEVRAGKADRVIAVGEAKWRSTAVGVDQVERLGHIAELIGATRAKRLCFSRSGFSKALTRAASVHANIELVDAARLYAGE